MQYVMTLISDITRENIKVIYRVYATPSNPSCRSSINRALYSKACIHCRTRFSWVLRDYVIDHEYTGAPCNPSHTLGEHGKEGLRIPCQVQPVGGS